MLLLFDVNDRQHQMFFAKSLRRTLDVTRIIELLRLSIFSLAVGLIAPSATANDVLSKIGCTSPGESLELPTKLHSDAESESWSTLVQSEIRASAAYLRCLRTYFNANEPKLTTAEANALVDERDAYLQRIHTVSTTWNALTHAKAESRTSE